MPKKKAELYRGRNPAHHPVVDRDKQRDRTKPCQWAGNADRRITNDLRQPESRAADKTVQPSSDIHRNSGKDRHLKAHRESCLQVP